jgi:hypothetical protein
MKKNFFYRIILLLSTSATIFSTSCKKEVEKAPKPQQDSIITSPAVSSSYIALRVSFSSSRYTRLIFRKYFPNSQSEDVYVRNNTRFKVTVIIECVENNGAGPKKTKHRFRLRSRQEMYVGVQYWSSYGMPFLRSWGIIKDYKGWN